MKQKSFIFVSIYIVVSLLTISKVLAANPVTPILPADNIQDPGALSTPWAGCGPTDSNCYITTSSHNPVTINATANGLSVDASQVLSLALASGATTGALSSLDWNTFNNKLGNTLNNGLIWIGNATNTATPVALSGDATLSNSGVLTISDASNLVRGFINTVAQTIAGQKTFTSNPVLSSMTQGSVFFAGSSGLISQDNTNLFWDDTSNNLGIGNNTPNAKVSVGTIFNSYDNNFNVSGPASTVAAFNGGVEIFKGNATSADLWLADDANYATGYGGLRYLGGAQKALVLNAYGSGDYESQIKLEGDAVTSNITFNTGGAFQSHKAILDVNGNFGIGTNILPSQKLDVNGNIKFSGALMPGGFTGSGNDILVSAGAGVAPVWTTPGSFISNYAVSSLNGLSGTTQTFATGTTGTDFGISSSGTVHTFNLPTASVVNRGALASADFSTFFNKIQTADNGLSITGTGTTKNVQLGGNLTQNTTVTNNGFSLTTQGASNLFHVDSIGRVLIGPAVSFSQVNTALNVNPYSSGRVARLGNFEITSGGAITGSSVGVRVDGATRTMQLFSSGATTDNTAFTFDGGASTSLDTQLMHRNTGEVSMVALVNPTSGGFVPTSGTATYNHLALLPSINQTLGTATGITRGLYVNPTLVGTPADYRAIETTVGNVILNSTGGKTGIGNTNPQNKLEITHGTAGNSGLRFTNLTNASTPSTYNNLQLSVDANGDVILTPDAVAANKAWSTVGNASTVDTTNFIGTTDAVGLRIKTNSLERMRWLSTGEMATNGATPLLTNASHIFRSLDSVNPAVRIENSAGTASMVIDNSGSMYSNSWSYGVGTLGNTKTINTQGAIGGTQLLLNSYNTCGSGCGMDLFKVINTSGVSSGFYPVSGSGVFNGINLNYRINQTGTANGITRGVFIDPIILAATDHRALEVTNGNVFLNSTSGNTGIGTLPTAQKLQVLGNIRAGASGTLGCLENFAGTALVGTCTSDERLKTNITDFNSSTLDKFADIRFVNYEWNTLSKDIYKKETGQIARGVLAQNIEALFPDLVSTDDKGYKIVDMTGLNWYAMQSIKELATGLTDINSPLEKEGKKTFTGKFFDRVTTWLGNAENGIKSIFVKEVKTEKLCVGNTCVTEEQLQRLLRQANQQPSLPNPVTVESRTVIDIPQSNITSDSVATN